MTPHETNHNSKNIAKGNNCLTFTCFWPNLSLILSKLRMKSNILKVSECLSLIMKIITLFVGFVGISLYDPLTSQYMKLLWREQRQFSFVVVTKIIFLKQSPDKNLQWFTTQNYIVNFIWNKYKLYELYLNFEKDVLIFLGMCK